MMRAAAHALEQAGYRDIILRSVWSFYCPLGEGTVAFISMNGRPGQDGAEGYVCTRYFGSSTIHETTLPLTQRPEEP
jgi:hypothetical protein